MRLLQKSHQPRCLRLASLMERTLFPRLFLIKILRVLTTLKAMVSLVVSRKLPLKKAASHYMVEKVEASDKDELVYSYSVIEGSVFMNKLEKITYETKLEPSSAGGSISKISCKYYTIGDFGITERLKAGKEKALQILKAVDACVLANPRH
ncbi:hypothetical protein Godav_013169 [Gossypium davidsonii]|uniref:Bet v I/Major latex protein domain-containing protein n=1 Tax=Gossypium davidsonii TaxID=34287 RepID=A0A7J8RG85_GOSDV|nr:hypothetical protein [Gossypium davidsonii]